MIAGLNLDRARPHRLRVGGGLRLIALEEAADAEHELARRERLGHVVVGAQLEAEDAIDLLAARGQEDDGDRAGLDAPPKLLEDVDPRKLGEHPVEHDEVGLLLAGRLERHESVPGDPDEEALPREDVPEELRDVRFIFDDEDPVRHAQDGTARASSRSYTGVKSL